MFSFIQLHICFVFNRKKRGRNRGHLKSTFLVTPKENWPPIGKPGIKRDNIKYLLKFKYALRNTSEIFFRSIHEVC